MKPQQIIDAWNNQADKYNHWDNLSEEEKLEWAIQILQPAQKEGLQEILERWEKWAYSTEVDGRNADLCDALKEFRASIDAELRQRLTDRIAALKDAFYAGFDAYETPAASQSNFDEKWAEFKAVPGITGEVK